MSAQKVGVISSPGSCSVSENTEINGSKESISPSKDNKHRASTGVSVELLNEKELSYDEQKEREHLERVVEKAFYEAGKALRILRDKRLYRSTHATFDDYCKDRFGYRRAYSYQIINAAEVVDNLQNCLLLADILPTAEVQVRPLTKLEPSEQRLCWQQAVEVAGGKTPSGKIVKGIVDKIRERTKVPNPYHLGEVCILQPKDNPELKGKKGCWGIVTHIGEYSCTVETWDGEYTVKVEDLSSPELTHDDSKFMQELCLRLRKLHKIPNRDSTINALLTVIGKECKPYLTPFQERLIETTEFFYNIVQF